MFDSAIVNLGFKYDERTSNSMKLELGDVVFLYILHGGTFFYEYYGKNKLSHITHTDINRSEFINMIQILNHI